MAQSYKVDTYRRHVYRLRPTPKLTIAAEVEPIPELAPLAVPEDARLGGSVHVEDATVAGLAAHDGPPQLSGGARREGDPLLAGRSAVDAGPELSPGVAPPLAPALREGALELLHPDEAPPPPVLSWIEVELLDEGGAPIAGQPYAVRATDGTTRFGRLGEGGRARVVEIVPGPCTVTFPGLDRAAWELVEEAPLPERSWIELELRGEDDQPLAQHTYVVREASGRVRRGVLDEHGKARVEGLEPGTCVVSFPELDRTAWEPIPERT